MPNVTEFLSRPRPVTWLFTGDSITQGAVHTRGWRDYTQLFKERLGELARNEDVVINTGVGGKTVTWCAQEVHDRLIRFQPHVVFCMFGTNDAAAGASGLSDFTQAYARMLAALRDASIEAIVLQTPPPIYPVDVDRHWGIQQSVVATGKLQALRNRLDHLSAYAAEIRRLAADLELPLVDHDQIWRQKYGGALGGLLDGALHPNEYGHRLLAQAIFRQLGVWSEASFTCRLFAPVPFEPSSEGKSNGVAG